MIPKPMSDAAKAALPYAIFVDFGPPEGVSDADCGHAGALVEQDGPHRDSTFPSQIHIPLQLEDGELEKLQAGETIWLNIAGRVLQPFSVNIGELPVTM